MNFSDLEKKILLDCVDDYISMWNIIRMQDLKISKDKPVSEAIVQNSLLAIRNLLQMELIAAGHLEKGKFRNSSLSPEEVTQRIKDEIKKFENTPLYYGFVFWFSVTQKGEELAKEITTTE